GRARELLALTGADRDPAPTLEHLAGDEHAETAGATGDDRDPSLEVDGAPAAGDRVTGAGPQKAEEHRAAPAHGACGVERSIGTGGRAGAWKTMGRLLCVPESGGGTRRRRTLATPAVGPDATRRVRRRPGGHMRLRISRSSSARSMSS